MNGEPVEIWGDGSVVRDYIYVSDVAEAFARAVKYDGERSVFNISTGIGTSLNELIDLVERAVGREVVRAVPSQPSFRRAGEHPRQFPGPTGARMGTPRHTRRGSGPDGWRGARDVSARRRIGN